MECSVGGVAATAPFAPTDNDLLPVIPTSIPGKLIAIDVTQERRSRLKIAKWLLHGRQKRSYRTNIPASRPRCTHPHLLFYILTCCFVNTNRG